MINLTTSTFTSTHTKTTPDFISVTGASDFSFNDIDNDALDLWSTEKTYSNELEAEMVNVQHSIFDGYSSEFYDRDTRWEELKDYFKENFISWEFIEGYPNYIVTTEGKVYNYNTAKEIKQCEQTSGYKVVSLCNKGEVKQRLVHRLVAEAFIENPNNLATVDHIYPDKSNNSVENLQWMSLYDNQSKSNKIVTN